MIKRHFYNQRFSLLMVVHSFRSERIGGVECYSYNLAKEMQAKGVSVTVLYPDSCSGTNDYTFDSFRYNGLKVVKIRVPFGDIVSSVSSAKIDGSFASFLKESRFDIVHFHHTYFHLSMTMVDIASQAGIPVAMTLHDFWFICPRTHLYIETNNQVCIGPESTDKCVRCFIDTNLFDDVNRAYEVYRALIEWRLSIAIKMLAKADLLYAPSHYVAEVYGYTGSGLGKIQISPLVVPKGRLVKNGSEELRIGYHGTISPLKNVVNLIKAFSHTKGLASLTIRGSGEAGHIDQVYENMNDRRIQYFGEYAPESLPELFSTIDLLVVPSWTESYCLTVREALSAGIPVIAANRGAIPEIVQDGVNGFLFNPAGTEQLTGIMQKIIDDRTILAQLDPGKVKITTIAEDAERLIADYQQIIDRKKSAVHGDTA